MSNDAEEIMLSDHTTVIAWLDRQQDLVCIAVRHWSDDGKRGGVFKLSLEALHRVKEAEEFPTLALVTPDSGAMFE